MVCNFKEGPHKISGYATESLTQPNAISYCIRHTPISLLNFGWISSVDGLSKFLFFSGSVQEIDENESTRKQSKKCRILIEV